MEAREESCLCVGDTGCGRACPGPSVALSVCPGPLCPWNKEAYPAGLPRGLLAALAFRASESTAECIGRLGVAVQRWVCDDQVWLCCPHSPQFFQRLLTQLHGSHTAAIYAGQRVVSGGRGPSLGGGSDRRAVEAAMGLLAWAVPKVHSDRRWPARDVVRGWGKGAGGQAFGGADGCWHH